MSLLLVNIRIYSLVRIFFCYYILTKGINIAVYTKQHFKCHPELAAKSVETKSKRDFMPLPGVSGSANIEIPK